MSETADFDLGDFAGALDDISSAAAPWVAAFTGKAVVPVSAGATPSQIAAAQQAQISLNAQQALANRAPVVSGLLNSPTTLLIIGAALVVLILFLLLR